jgi:hypothetical protein
MKEHPILFSTEMVKAILAGNKTQTRRVILRRERDEVGSIRIRPENNYSVDMILQCFKCPYGKTGDHLWVRESFSTVDKGNFIIYKADGLTAEEVGIDKIRWKPSIHMPRRFCRIKLEVIDIRVERVQDISIPDVDAEGFGWHDQWDCLPDFAKTWNNINGKRGFGWDVNPFVWVITFQVERKSNEQKS